MEEKSGIRSEVIRRLRLTQYQGRYDEEDISIRTNWEEIFEKLDEAGSSFAKSLH